MSRFQSSYPRLIPLNSFLESGFHLHSMPRNELLILTTETSLPWFGEIMQPAILSIARETLASPIRNAVLARAGYSVIPAFSAASALKILHKRHVCAMIIAHCVPDHDCRLLCTEAHRRGVPSVVLDPYEQMGSDRHELHVSPLEGPQGLLDALASLIVRNRECASWDNTARLWECPPRGSRSACAHSTRKSSLAHVARA